MIYRTPLLLLNCSLKFLSLFYYPITIIVQKFVKRVDPYLNNSCVDDGKAGVDTRTIYTEKYYVNYSTQARLKYLKYAYIYTLKSPVPLQSTFILLQRRTTIFYLTTNNHDKAKIKKTHQERSLAKTIKKLRVSRRLPELQSSNCSFQAVESS